MVPGAIFAWRGLYSRPLFSIISKLAQASPAQRLGAPFVPGRQSARAAAERTAPLGLASRGAQNDWARRFAGRGALLFACRKEPSARLALCFALLFVFVFVLFFRLFSLAASRALAAFAIRRAKNATRPGLARREKPVRRSPSIGERPGEARVSAPIFSPKEKTPGIGLGFLLCLAAAEAASISPSCSCAC